VPGFEAPVMLAYSARNRSASIRIPYVANPKGRRIEVRFPDSTANPYLAFAAMLMAGLDGIQNKIHPGDAMDKDLYDLPPEEKQIPQEGPGALDHPTVCHAPRPGPGGPRRGPRVPQGRRRGPFTDDCCMIDAYIELKMAAKSGGRLRMTTHPVEFDMYYSCSYGRPRSCSPPVNNPPESRRHGASRRGIHAL
jgi:glutamine synthetase